MIDYIMKGGVIMIPIVLCSVLALGIILERLWRLRWKRILRYDLLNRIEELLREQKTPEATTLCKHHASIMTRILTVSELLGTITSISPLLGLLGTMAGLLKVCEAMAQAGGVTNAGILSEGIHNALITMVCGLCVAIPSLVAYNYLTRQVEGLVLEVECISLRLLNILKRHAIHYWSISAHQP